MTLRIYEPDRNLMAWLASMGIPAPARIHMVYSSGTAAQYSWFRSIIDDANMHSSLATAYDALETGRNDVALVTQEAHSLAATLTWAHNYTHLIGMSPPSRFFDGAYPAISASANIQPMLHVTGAGNLFRGLSVVYGRGNTNDNLSALRIGSSAVNNTFIGCHFDGPQNAAEAADVESTLVWVQAASYFKDCTFGCFWQTMTEGRMLQFGHGASSPACVFENCNFIMRANGANPRFIRVQPDTSISAVFFRGCQFLNVGTTDLTYAIAGEGMDGGADPTYLFFDANCSFSGVADIVSANMETYVRCAVANLAGTASVGTNGLKLANLIATTPDVS